VQRVGFDWEDHEGSKQKVHEELAAAHEKDISASYLEATGKVWKVQAGLGVGAKQQLGAQPSVTVDYWAEYLIPTTAVTIGNVVGGTALASNSGGARVGMTLEY